MAEHEHVVDARLRRFTTDLAAHLDVEAGLREVLHGDPPAADGARTVVTRVAALPPERRVRLRAHPVLRTFGLASVSLEARTVAENVGFVLMVYPGTGDVTDLPAHLDHTLGPGYRHTRSAALHAALRRAGAPVGEHTALLALAADLDRAVRAPGAGLRALVGIPDRLRYYARTTQAVFVREMHLALDGADDAERADDVDAALRGLRDEHRAATVCWLGRHLDDLRGTDLRWADLRDVPLAGARWSAGTRWPSGWAAWVAWNSAPAADAPGEFVVRG